MLSASTLAKKSSRKPTTTLEVAAKYTINNNLRELNQLLQSQDEKENKEKSSPKMDKIQKTFETLLRALETLAKLETRNKTYNLDIEKAYYNVITKMIDFGLQENALKTARLLHSRLLKCFGKCSIATNLRHQSTTSINETNISKLKYSSDLITFFGDLCVLPLEIETKNHEEILLVIAYQLCVLRALIEYKDGQLIKLIPACFEMTGNVFDWCQKLGKLRKDIAAKQYGILIRMLSRASSQLQSLSGNNCIEILRLRAFSLRAFVETEQFKLPLFFEQCLKVGTQFEKNLKINPKISFKALLCFYQDMNRIIQPYVDQSPKCHSNLLKSATIKLSIGHLAIESLISEEEDIKYFAYIRDAKESFSTLEAAFVNESLSQEEFIDLSNLLKKGELLRKSCKTVCEMMNIGKKQDSMNLGISNKKKNTKNLALLQTPQDKERLYKAIGALVWSGASFFGIICEKLFSQYKAQHQINPCLFPPDRLFLVTLDMFDLFLRTTFNISDPHSYAICTSFIERALVIARTNCLEEPLRWISNSYYYIGGILYRENQNQDAVEPIRKSCNFLYNYLYYAKPEGKMLQEEEIKLQLGKRFEVLGACHTALGEIENARNAFEQSLRSFPISEYDKFSSLMKEESVLVASQHLPIIPRLIDRHVKSSYIDSPDAVFTPTHEIMMITRGEGIKVAGLVEYQIRVLKSHGNKVDTYKVQMTLCEKLLEWYSVEDFPLRRARVLLEQSKLMRSSKNQKDREHTLVLLATAKELLKTEEIGEDSGLYKLKQFYLATAYSWSSIVSQECRQRFPEGFKIALTLWKGILIDIHPFGDGSIVTENHLEEAKKKIDDPQRYYGELQMLSDFLGVCHQPIDQILTLKLMLRMNNGLTPNSQEVHSDSMALYNQMGLIYLNLGYTGKAGLAFSKAKMIMDSCNVVNETKLKWILGYSQYLCCIGNFPKSSQYFDQAQILANSKPPEPKVISHPNNLKRRKGEQMLLADASFTRSVIASRLGLLEAAILDSTRTLRLLNRIISNINSNISMQLINTIDENPFLVEDSTHLSVSKSKDSCKILSFTDQCFLWPVLKRLLTCFQHLGQLYVIRGSPKEADFFLRRGLELTQGINGYSAISHSLLSLAVLDSQKHSWQDSEDNFEKALKFQQEGEVVKKDEAVAKLFFGDLKFRKRDYETALQLYRLAENILSDIMKQEYISHMELINLNVFQTPRSKKLISISPLTPKSKSSTDGNIQFECFLLTHIKADLFRREGLVLTKQKKFDDGFQIIQNCKVINQSRLEKIEHLLALGKNRIQYIISKLSQPPFSTFEIFSESVLSLPPIKQTSKGRVKVRSDEIIHLDCEIEQATGYLKEAFDLAFESGTTHSLHDIAFALAKIYMIKAYNQKSTSVQRSDLVIACVFYLEMTKGIAAKREMIAAISERLVPAYKFDDKKWPSGFSTIVNNQNLNEEIFDEENQMNNLNFFSSLGKLYKKEINMTYDQFKSQFIDILPPHWTICTISIDTEFEEMYICRLHQKNQPLILRLPLIRQPNQEGQENFSYETMIAELNDIINASNVTMRAGKAYETIKEKTEWWNKRKELDERLQQLLANIENCWLGGFKGIFRTNPDNNEMMYKFKSKIETIISKVVQNLICKKSKDQTSKKSPSFDIDIDVELCKVFFDLGQEASAEDIEDFLYFLLDTYHYNGVPIAYDEVNMNQLIADVQDIINSFSAFKPIDTEKQKGATEHIILILDKSVQMIPWESLPCLRTRPISRLPSLTFLRDRILLAQEKNVQKPGVWAEHTIDRRKVFYVLNPSQDLKNTEKEFKNFLQSYETWDGVIGRAPILQECKNGLANNDLYIYFGHGSGDQYIRGPQVRQLDRCAVTLLMGCSSGYLKPAGEFDPTGTALSYIMSGWHSIESDNYIVMNISPALVGTLWDVTDKDIDRYSKALFQEWGLDPKISPSNKTTSNVNISQRQNLQPEHQISLVEAVSMVRDNCVLKYLNGAAPVVYGIPCYLVTDH